MSILFQSSRTIRIPRISGKKTRVENSCLSNVAILHFHLARFCNIAWGDSVMCQALMQMWKSNAPLASDVSSLSGIPHGAGVRAFCSFLMLP